MIYSLIILKREYEKLKKEHDRIMKVMVVNDFQNIEPSNSLAIKEIEKRIYDLDCSMKLLSKEL